MILEKLNAKKDLSSEIDCNFKEICFGGVMKCIAICIVGVECYFKRVISNNNRIIEDYCYRCDTSTCMQRKGII